MVNGVGLLARASRARERMLASTAVLAVAVGSGGLAWAEQQDFTIQPQAMGAALVEFAQQADIEVLYDDEDVADLTTGGVTGASSRDEALDRLLKGSGLRFNFEADDLIVVRPAEATAGSGRIRVNSNTHHFDNGDDNGDQLAQMSEARRQTRVADAGGGASLASLDEGDFGEGAAVEHMIVTGSLIRGTKASIGSALMTIDRDDIELGGFGTVQEAIQSLPNVFKGGISEDSRSTDNATNFSGGTSINLRGLGVGSTLTLVNGRRLAAGGTDGSFVDISNIPASLIERIEVLADGASATYGSDAIGGVVNVILRDDFDGAETGFRFGTVTEGGTQEYRANQTFGKNWDSGNALISYEYYDRGELGYDERSFTASSDLRPLGGDDFRTTFSVPGNILDPATGFQTVAFAIPDGQDGTNLTSVDLLPGQINLFELNEGRLLLFDQNRHSVFGSVSQKFSDGIEVFSDIRYSERSFRRESVAVGDQRTLFVPATNPFFVDPFGGSPFVAVRYSGFEDFGALSRNGGDAESLNGVFGLRAELRSDWQLQAYGSYSEEGLRIVGQFIDDTALNLALADTNPATAFNPFGDGSFQQNPDTIRSITVDSFQNVESNIWTGNFVIDGSLLNVPAGKVKLALGANYDRYSLDSLSEDQVNGTLRSHFQREVTAVFGELFLPIFDKENSRTGLERLIISASVRYEDYSDVGDTTNPKVGLLWRPIEGLDIRGTYGTSFRAPDLTELDTTDNRIVALPFADPMSATGVTLSLLRLGNNDNLENETARSWTVGFDYSPPFIPALTMDLTYYNVRFENRIVSAASAALSILFQEDRFAAAIIRNPSQQQIDDACENSGFFIGSPPCNATPAGAIIDARPINAGITRTDGLDFNVRYEVETENLGRFDFHVGGTYIFNFDEAFGPTAPITALLDTVGNPIDLRLRSSASWSNQRGLSAKAFLNYNGGYIDNVSDPERKIENWTTVDLTLAYDTKDRFTNIEFDDVRLLLSVRNLLDNNPPFVNNFNGIAYDPENASPLGRFISFTITKVW